MKLQRFGGYAAIASVCGYLILVTFANLRLKGFSSLSDPIKAMNAMSSAPADFYVLDLLLMFCCILWLIATLALNERMQANAPNLTRLATIAASVGTAAGIVMGIAGTQAIEVIAPTKDISAYRAFNAMTGSLWAVAGYAYGWVGLLIGCAVLRTRAFPKTPGWLFILAGIFWVRIPIPIKLGIVGVVPWLLCLVSFVWFGVVLLRQKQSQPASKEMAASR